VRDASAPSSVALLTACGSHRADPDRAVLRQDLERQLAACRERSAPTANLDDDGKPDHVVHTYLSIRGDPGMARLVVCLGNGRILTRRGIGMREELEVSDIDGDGRAEVYSVATPWGAFSLGPI